MIRGVPEGLATHPLARVGSDPIRHPAHGRAACAACRFGPPAQLQAPSLRPIQVLLEGTQQWLLLSKNKAGLDRSSRRHVLAKVDERPAFIGLRLQDSLRED